MPTYPLQIAVIGGATCDERQRELARETGQGIARAGAILLCGGRCSKLVILTDWKSNLHCHLSAARDVPLMEPCGRNFLDQPADCLQAKIIQPPGVAEKMQPVEVNNLQAGFAGQAGGGRENCCR